MKQIFSTSYEPNDSGTFKTSFVLLTAVGMCIRLIRDVAGIHTQPTLFTKAWKMNGLAFGNVNYKEIQLTPGARKDTPICELRKTSGYVFVQTHNQNNMLNTHTHTPTRRGTIQH